MLAQLLFLLQVTTPDTIHIDIDGADRIAYVCIPQTQAKDSPVVFMFHGHGGSAQRCMQRFQMEKKWPEAVVVYCDGLPVTTAGGNGQGWELEATDANRDIKFFDALLPKILTQYHGDPKHVFAWGFSNGGMFMYTLWTLRPDKFAGFCASGSCFASDDIHLDKPKAVFITISSDDPIVPTNYQEDAYESIRNTDHSEKDGKPYGDGGTYFNGTEPVVVWRYKGGHEFPFESFPKLIDFFKSIK